MTYDLGQFQMRLRGSYNASTAYNFLDVVYYNGGSYCCKADGTKGKVPTNTTYWQQIAAAGQSTLTPAQKAEIVAALIEQQGIVIDPDYNQFSTEEKQKLADLTEPNNATLTLQVNNRAVGTWNANSSTNKTFNISVPTDYIPRATVQTFTEQDVVIDALKFGMVYVLTAASTLVVRGYEDEMRDVADYFTKYNDNPTYFYIRPKEQLELRLPDMSLLVRGCTLTLDAGEWYRVTCRAAVWNVELLASIK